MTKAQRDVAPLYTNSDGAKCIFLQIKGPSKPPRPTIILTIIKLSSHYKSTLHTAKYFTEEEESESAYADAMS